MEFGRIEELREAAAREDWSRAAALADGLAGEAAPGDAAGLREYLGRLSEALVTARASRASLLALSARLRAAQMFHEGDASPRQNFGELADS